jgi:oligopeptide transport system substrate-binding protein
MSRKKWALAGTLIAITFLMFESGCTLKKSAPKQTIHIGNGTEPKDLDPAKIEGVYEHELVKEIFEPLVIEDPNGKLVPSAAASWTSSPDGRVWTFKIQPQAKWSNGDPLEAKDFVYAWTRLLDPATASQYASMAYVVKGGEAFNKGKVKDPSALGLKAIDAKTFEVTLENPTSYFLSMLDHQVFYPLHKASVEKHGMRWTRPENIVTTGPFKLSKWEANKVITMVKDPNYWNAASVKLEEANYYPMDNIDTEEKMFRTKQLQITREVPPEKIEYWKSDKSGVFRSEDYFGNYFFRLNITKKPLNDKKVRRALALAIDRNRLVTFVTKGNQQPALALVPPVPNGYQPNPSLPPDGSRIEEAKKLLAEAGYPEGKGFPSVEILYNTQEIHKKLCEALQQMWKQNLGIEVKIINQEWKVYLASMQTLNYDIARAGWIGDYVDPFTFLELWTTGNGNNMTGFANKKYDGLIAASTKEMDEAKRFKTLHEAEDLLMDEMPIIPIYIWRRNYLASKEVVGWKPSLRGFQHLRFVSIQ